MAVRERRPAWRGLQAPLRELGRRLSGSPLHDGARLALGDLELEAAELAAFVPATLAIVAAASDGPGARVRHVESPAAWAECLPLPDHAPGPWLHALADACHRDAELACAFADVAQVVQQGGLDWQQSLHAYGALLGIVDDAAARRHGAYYTPWPLAQHMVATLDAALRRVGLGGVAGDGTGACIVDPATGSGVFLVALMAHLSACGGPWSGLSGIEPMGGARALCRQQLAACAVRAGRAAEASLVVRVEPGSFLSASDAPPAVAIIGNPPYRRGHAREGNADRRALLAPYRVGLQGERNLQPLSDDYIAFMRAAQLRLSSRERAVLCMVTNHAYLRGHLHRVMRQSLLETFPAVDVLDLAGSVRVRRPDAVRDENVFGVAQGVCVATMLRSPGVRPGVRHVELRGRRDDKLARLSGPLAYEVLDGADADAPWAPREQVPAEYARFVPLTALFSFHAVAGKPGDDRTLVGFEPAQLLTGLAARRRALSEQRAPRSEAARKLESRPLDVPFDEARVVPYAYRPFDTRFVYDDPALWTRPPNKLRAAMAGGPVLLTTRLLRDAAFAHVLAVRELPDVIALSATSSVNAYAFPLSRLTPEPLSPAFGAPVSSRDAFGYIYAVLHSASYRTRYLGALRADFPCIPVARDSALSARLVALGQRLLDAHLAPPPTGGAECPRFVDGGDRRIVRVGEPGRRLATVAGGARLYINAVSYFEGIEPGCYAFRVGAYQVCHKWLDDRRRAGRALSDDDVRRYTGLIARVAATRSLQTAVDDAISAAGGWEVAFR